MVMMKIQGGGGGAPVRAKNTAQTRAATAVVRPALTSRSAAQNNYVPPAPVYNPPPAPVYNAPAPIYGGGGGGGGFVGGGQTFSAPAPPPPPPPPSRPARLSAADWLEGDSAYQDQMSEYDRALKTFIGRITKEKEQFNLDNDVAVKGNARNRGVAMDDQAEDFAARGMINSGVFGQESQQLGDRFNEQDSLLARILQRQMSDAGNRQEDFQTETQLGRGNAKRSALARMAAKQAIMDQDFNSQMASYNARY